MISILILRMIQFIRRFLFALFLIISPVFAYTLCQFFIEPSDGLHPLSGKGFLHGKTNPAPPLFS